MHVRIRTINGTLHFVTVYPYVQPAREMWRQHASRGYKSVDIASASNIASDLWDYIETKEDND